MPKQVKHQTIFESALTSSAAVRYDAPYSEIKTDILCAADSIQFFFFVENSS